MPSLNKVILIGHMTADPELRQTESGISVTSFSIGVSRKYTKQGEQAQSDFPNIIAWRGTAEFICKYFRKGNAICICGSLQTRTYTDKNDVKHYVTEVVADEVNFVESKSKQGDLSDDDESLSNTNKPKFEELSDEEDLPF